MARKSTIKLLLVNESENEAERLISLFRNAGRVARAHRIESSEALFDALKNVDNWDILIADDHHPEITPEQCLEQRKKCKTDLPIIVIRNKNDTIKDLYSAGAAEVIAADDETRLNYACFREVDHYHLKRQYAAVKLQLSDAEKRCEELLEQSQDAIAYVSDGMIIGANSLFSEQFGYNDPADLDCLPVIDLIKACDQDNFKTLLKAQPNNSDSCQFSFTGTQENDNEFVAQMLLSNTIYDNENCVQLTITHSNGGAAVASEHDSITGTYSHDFFISQLQKQLQLAAAGNHISSVLFISIDDFHAIRARLGILFAQDVAVNIAQYIQPLVPADSCLSHYCDDGFALILANTGSDKATELANNLCKKIEKHIVEINGQSIQCTASIGVTTLDQHSQEPTSIIDGVFKACETGRQEKSHSGVSIYVPVRERKALGDAQNDSELDKILEEALEDQHIRMSFQPIVSLRGSSGDHYEVHLNVLNSDDEIINADDFINSLQFNNVNTRLDRWILLEASKKLSAERDKGQDIRLIINLTEQALQDSTLIPWLSVALKAGGLPPEAIILQFSEADIADNLTAAIEFSKNLQSFGCPIAIKHFGENSSPIKLLNHVNAAFTRLSNRFTEQLGTDNDMTPLKNLVASINDHKAKSIVPNIKNASALAILWQIGADFIQGDYLAAASSEMNHEFTDIA